MIKKNRLNTVGALMALGLPLAAGAVETVNDTLTGTSSSFNWAEPNPGNGMSNSACLTAGNGSGSIPKCVGLPANNGKALGGGNSGALPDPAGSGALRLTNGDGVQGGGNGNYTVGSVVSNFTFGSSQGINVTFTTLTYGGNGYKNGAGAKSGADGMSFYLSDGSQPPSVGASGGSIAYSCSNGNPRADGVMGAYLGIGIDEFGNFSNPSDNTSTGPGVKPGSIVVRGAGNINWAALNAANPSYYPSGLSPSDQVTAVQDTCSTGTLWNFSGGAGNAYDTQRPLLDANGKPILDYAFIARSGLPSGTTIYSQEATGNSSNPSKSLRKNATPITYTVNITGNGVASVGYSVNGGSYIPMITNQDVTGTSGLPPLNYRFGFGAGTGGGSNIHEISCFQAAAQSQASSSAGTNTLPSAKVQAGTQLYLAYYNPPTSTTGWWGQLTASGLSYDATGTLVPGSANWDASCVLTGGVCASTSTSSSSTSSSASAEPWANSSSNATAPTAGRVIITAKGTGTGFTGTPFEWSSGALSSTEMSAVDTTAAGASSTASTVLNFVRGDRSNELTTAGVGQFRARTSVLGDIQNSSPTWIGGPQLSYAGTWNDLRYPAAPAAESGYASFASSYATRQNVVYIGANDGILHGFRAGSFDASGNYAASTNDGLEVLGYIPSLVLSTLRTATTKLDFPNTKYAHNGYVDATPGTGDIYYGGKWHTWLAGGLGSGGNATGQIGDSTSTGQGEIYALDITDPSAFTEANAAKLVLFDKTSVSGNDLDVISCVGNSSCNKNMGSTYGTPLIRRLHDGNWAVIFGNGLNSSSGTAGVFIMEIDGTTGKPANTYFLDTGYGSAQDPSGSGSKNGIAYVSSADLDGDHITDYLYAGDVFGNVWRFDLTGNTASSWAAAPQPLFSTGGLPITTQVKAVSITPSRLLLTFGTGQKFPQTLTSATSYASGTQYLFGIWDWNMAAWNAKSSYQYATVSSGPTTIAVSSLASQTISTTSGSGSSAITGYETVSNNPVCWAGGTACTSGNTQYGWRVPLPGSQEQIIYNPIIFDGSIMVNTYIPEVVSTLSCNATTKPTGYTLSLDVGNGGTGAPHLGSSNGTIISGISVGGVGSPLIFNAGQDEKSPTPPNMCTETGNGSAFCTGLKGTNSFKARRKSWIRLR